ncbi:MAG: GNAT family N-acetyltransferase [Ruminococcus sp.]|nr:GNAT family N-acetyltransferase [Ruminococcus sp.]
MLTHKGTQTLSTERLVLRRFTTKDAQNMYDNWASDSRVTRYLTWLPHKSPAETEEILKMWCNDYPNPDYYQWAIEYNGTPIGSIAVVRISERDDLAELGYCMGYDYWGQGLMSEAVKAVIDFLFGKVSANRVCICHAVKNPASGKVAKKCGLSYEGTLRQEFRSHTGEFLDIAVHGITRDQWAKGE